MVKGSLGLVLALTTITAIAQTAAPAAGQKSVKADNVTINMPDGISRDQADQILNELKAIHQLLLRQQNIAGPGQAIQPQTEKVKMSVTEGWYSLGKPDAPVTIVEFSDYQCPFCRRYHSETFAEIKKQYIDTGKVRYVSRDMPLEFHQNAPAAALAARCAGEQKKFWELRELMLAKDADLSPDSIKKYAAQTNLDMTAFTACLNDKTKSEAIQKDIADAGKLGISGTPSFVVAKTSKTEMDGVKIVGAVPYSVFESTINAQLTATAKP